MRADSPYGNLLEQKSSDQQPYQADGRIIQYMVRNQSPETIYPPTYQNGSGLGCEPAGDPLHPDMCLDGDQAALNLLDYLQSEYPHCTFSNSGFSGSHAEPFYEVRPVGSRYGEINAINPDEEGRRRLVYDVWCSGWGPDAPPDTRYIFVFKMQTFLCPVNFTAVSGYHSGYAPSPTAPKIDNPYRCAPTEPMPQIVVTGFKQTNSCAAGKNPCYPATGDKARTEPDFQFAGTSFSRHYHSLRQTGMVPAFAPGWTHTYSDRVLSDLDAGYYVVGDDGYAEYYERIVPSDATAYRSTESSRKKLTVFPDEGYALTDESGRIKYFNASGRLIRIENPSRPGDAVDLAYDGDKLARATDSNGRSLAFHYVDDRLSGIALPDGASIDYAYDANSNFSAVSYPGGVTKTYHYNEAGLSAANDLHALTGITAETGQRFGSFGYNADGQVIVSKLHKGDDTFVEKTELNYLSASQVEVTTPSGELRTYTIAADGVYRRITGVTGAAGTVSTDYLDGAISQRTDALGAVSKYEYADGYLSGRIDAFGTPQERKVTLVRDAEYRLTSQEAQIPSGGVYVARSMGTWTYNTRGQALTARRSIRSPARHAPPRWPTANRPTSPPAPVRCWAW